MAATLAMRFIGFGQSVIDWDEATYLLISKAMLGNGELYVDAWDTKPPGIFLLFAVLQSLFSDGILSVRIAACVFIAATSFLLYKITLHFRSDDYAAGILSGLLYLTSISFLSPSMGLSRGYGLEANTEMFFLFFTSLGALLLFRSRGRLIQLFLAGLALGLGFIIKYFVVFDMLALGAILLLITYRNRDRVSYHWMGDFFRQSLPLVAGSVLPFALVWSYFYFLSGNFDAFYEVTFVIAGKYASPITAGDFFSFWGDFFYVTSITALCGFATLLIYIRKKRSTYQQAYLLIWLGFTILAATLPGKFFFHYLYQTYLPYCLLAGLVVSKSILPATAARQKVITWTFGVIMGLIPIVSAIKYQVAFNKPDYPRIIANHINENAGPDKSIFVDNYDHIIYYLTDCLPPTKYYHTSLLTETKHRSILRIDQDSIYTEIFSRKPHYVIYKEDPTTWYIIKHLVDYEEEKVFDEDIYLLRRKESGNQELGK